MKYLLMIVLRVMLFGHKLVGSDNVVKISYRLYWRIKQNYCTLNDLGQFEPTLNPESNL